MLIQIITTVAILSLINAGLALLLVLAEHLFANYGNCIISVNSEDELTVIGGMSLLSSLNSHKIFLPSACGGRGTCGYCKCQIMEGAGSVLPTETSLLTESEISDQFRIACQVKVKNDLSIKVPEELFNIKEFSTDVDSILDLTHDIKLVRLRLVDPDEINFTPGQYVQLISQPYEKIKESVSRAYSIASPGHQKGMIELMIRLVPDGIC
ncbi:oxidoreductase, partial [bacterium I07]